MREHVSPITIVPPTTTAVDVALTPILAATNLRYFDRLLFAFHNDGLFPVDVVISTGEFAGVWDAEVAPTLTIAAGEQRSWTTDANMRTNYRVSATASGGASSLNWAVRGLGRARSEI